jgi:hypothetical protein
MGALAKGPLVGMEDHGEDTISVALTISLHDVFSFFSHSMRLSRASYRERREENIQKLFCLLVSGPTDVGVYQLTDAVFHALKVKRSWKAIRTLPCLKAHCPKISQEPYLAFAA